MPEPIFWSVGAASRLHFLRKAKNKSLFFVLTMNSVQYIKMNKIQERILIINFFRAQNDNFSVLSRSRSRLEPLFLLQNTIKWCKIIQVSSASFRHGYSLIHILFCQCLGLKDMPEDDEYFCPDCKTGRKYCAARITRFYVTVGIYLYFLDLGVQKTVPKAKTELEKHTGNQE